MAVKLGGGLGDAARGLLTTVLEKFTKDQNKLGAESGKATKSLKEQAGGLKMVADVLGQVRAVGSDAFAGISSGLAAITKGDMKGAIEGITDAVASLAQSLDLLVPGLGQAASALVKFAGGGIGLLYELGKKTIDENQKLIELTNTFDALGSLTGNTGAEMLDNFKELSRELPQTRAQLADMARPLLEAGIQGDKLDRSLRAQSAAISMLGERGGHAYASATERVIAAQRTLYPIVTSSRQELAKMGLTSKDMAEQMGVSTERMNMQLRFGAFNAGQFGQALDQALAKKGANASRSLMSTLGTLLPKWKRRWGCSSSSRVTSSRGSRSFRRCSRSLETSSTSQPSPARCSTRRSKTSWTACYRRPGTFSTLRAADSRCSSLCG